ncbi:FMN-binding negative transcriptional regulator [Fibrella forsythiae]|uniref:FMN-binding negative transcriptional regulator n=1 Tax=Fibrella forsythiae TaxID=2817061 RepID=A0ABS3JKG9_9BACT|nr:FMN-binding negative transcriptional regulator [Fibrella forsythiae]MBO0950490.1 FMN-binding negative transcriptional regulator [Fibrella forsythiae]
MTTITDDQLPVVYTPTMYVPKHFQENDRKELLQFMREHSFALLVLTNEAGVPIATHLPIKLQVDADGTALLIGHISKANQLATLFGKQTPALAVFSGPHAYISSSWYDHVNVPTWNYLSVQVYGRTRVLTDEETLALLRTQVDKYETASACPVSIESMTEAYVRQQMKGLIAFELTIETMQGAAKLSQNRDDVNHAAIVKQLRQRDDVESHRVADEMEKRREGNSK